MRKDYNQQFEKDFSQLNAEQKDAVTQTEGPLLVVAGPGTGKTQILASRIAHILNTTDATPENILCLTYTDAGTIAMRNRLLQFIGADAYRVDIFTFHAFCNTVIQDNLDYFGLRALTAVSDLERIELVHKIIDEFPKGHPLKRYAGEIYYDTNRLLSLYDVMKREGWTPEFIESRVESYINDLPNREEYIYKRATKDAKKGDVNQKKIDEQKEKMTVLVAAAKTFYTYEELMRKNNRYDFADMILWVVRAFKEKSEMLLRYQEQYLYFLVDEYQDTSGSQNNLLDLLISYWNEPNVFCVGDDDQSIFRFQGANVENIAHFANTYSPNRITLSENYRSNQFILDLADALIRNNKVRIDPNKKLKSANPRFDKSGVKPEIRAYHNQAHETTAIAHEIEKLKNEGVSLNEIAVLYRNHRQAAELHRYLEAKNIPVHIKRKANILEEIFIKKLLVILRYLAAEAKKPHSGEIHIYEMLHFDFFKIAPLDISKISIEVYKKNFNERATSWREELAKSKNKLDLFTQSADNPLKKASDMIEGWIKNQANLTLQQLIEAIITESGILFSALTSTNRVWQMQMLHTFFDFIKSECEKNAHLTLAELMNTIDLMAKEEVSLPAMQVSYAPEGVQFITAHSAKGLEFEYVFLIGSLKKVWDEKGRSNTFSLPDTLFEINVTDNVEENRRLFYVALTRAKQYLVITYPQQDDSGKELEKSRFVAELESDAGIASVEHFASDEQLANFALHTLQSQPTLPLENLFDNPLVDDILANYSLSVTHLNSYLHCPTAFYFNNLIRVPAPMSAAATFGSAIHYALERLFKNMNTHEQKQFAPVEDIIKDFKWYIRRNQEAFTDIEFKRRLEYGEDILPKYYNQYISHWNKITSVERTYRNVVVKGVPMNGKLDKLEFDGTSVNVVDYKTGQFSNTKKKFARPNNEAVEKSRSEKNEPSFESLYGGDYWRQAVFYKILMDNDKGKKWEMRSAEFDFVEPDKTTGEFHKQLVSIAIEDIDIVTNQITEVYKHIRMKYFSKGCMEMDCRWCNFKKEMLNAKC